MLLKGPPPCIAKKVQILALSAMMKCLKEKCILDECIIYRKNCPMFLNIVNQCILLLQSSVNCVRQSSYHCLCLHGNLVKRIGDRVVPYGISDINDLFDIMFKLQQMQ